MQDWEALKRSFKLKYSLVTMTANIFSDNRRILSENFSPLSSFKSYKMFNISVNEGLKKKLGMGYFRGVFEKWNSISIDWKFYGELENCGKGYFWWFLYYLSSGFALQHCWINLEKDSGTVGGISGLLLSTATWIAKSICLTPLYGSNLVIYIKKLLN